MDRRPHGASAAFTPPRGRRHIANRVELRGRRSGFVRGRRLSAAVHRHRLLARVREPTRAFALGHESVQLDTPMRRLAACLPAGQAAPLVHMVLAYHAARVAPADRALRELVQPAL